MQKQPNCSFSFVCGQENVAGVKARFFETVSANGTSEILARFSGQLCHQGHPGRVQGGVLTGVLDETIARAINYCSGINVERWGITAELTTRFLNPVPLEMEVSALGRVLTQNCRMFTDSGEICLADGTVAVRAEGRFLKLPLSAISGQNVDLPGWKVYQDEESENPI